MYAPRGGRFWSVDPLAPEYPWYTPYQFAGNKPIWAIDLDGLEEYKITEVKKLGYNTFDVVGSTELHIKVIDLSTQGVSRDKFNEAKKIHESRIREMITFPGAKNSHATPLEDYMGHKIFSPGGERLISERYNVSTNVTISKVSSLDEIEEGDYVMILVDNFTRRKTTQKQKDEGVKTETFLDDGFGQKPGRFSTVSALSFLNGSTHTVEHEIGHNLGLPHACNHNCNNLMSYKDPTSYTLTGPAP